MRPFLRRPLRLQTHNEPANKPTHNDRSHKLTLNKRRSRPIFSERATSKRRGMLRAMAGLGEGDNVIEIGPRLMFPPNSI